LGFIFRMGDVTSSHFIQTNLLNSLGDLLNIVLLGTPAVLTTASLLGNLLVAGSTVTIKFTLGNAITTSMETMGVSIAGVGALSVVGSWRGTRRGSIRNPSGYIVLEDVKNVSRVDRLLAFHRTGCTNTTAGWC